jgi:hypothetical protein
MYVWLVLARVGLRGVDVDLATGEREARHASEKSCRGLAGLSIVVSLVSLRSHSDLLILTQPKTPTQPACWLDLCLYIVSCISKSLLVHPLTKDMIVSKHRNICSRARLHVRGDAPRARLYRGFSPKSLRGRHLGARAAQSRSFHELVV